MSLELNLAPFLLPSTFLNYCLAFENVNVGINHEMFHIGATLGLNPYDLQKIIENQNFKLNRNEIIFLLKQIVSSLDYFYNYRKFSFMGFSPMEISILSFGSVAVENIVTYNEQQLFYAMGFNKDYRNQIYFTTNNIRPDQIFPFVKAGLTYDHTYSIQTYIQKNIQPHEIFPYIQAGFSYEDHFYLESYIKNNIPATQARPFFLIGLKYEFEIEEYVNVDLTADEVHPFLQFEQRHNLMISSYEIICYIKNNIPANEVHPFLQFGQEYNLTISRYEIIHYIKNNIPSNKIFEVNRTNQILFTLIVMTILSFLWMYFLKTFLSNQSYCIKRKSFWLKHGKNISCDSSLTEIYKFLLFSIFVHCVLFGITLINEIPPSNTNIENKRNL
jgi:cell division protein FtsL